MQVDTSQEIIGRRYRLGEPLGAGGMGTVFQAQDRLTGASVALKRVLAPEKQLILNSTHPSVNLRLALAQEFQWLAGLKHPNIITVLDYGFDAEQHPYFTMELLSNAQTIREAAHNQSLEVQVSLIVQLLYALTYLHHRNIVHRDLKPANVLVVDNRVKVLDFGLSVQTSQSVDSSGTLAYMAPEVLMGDPATFASDLYSLGIIIYEILSGKHPFDIKSITTLTQQILTESPDLSGDISASPLMPIVQRLLEKDANARYASAGALIQAINQATGQSYPIETQEIRESFLQSVPLTGRATELQQLLGALNAVVNKQGNAWLIGGESGIGKSRLLDELRIQALVHGTMVIRGQAISDGSSAFEVWRNVFRWLALLIDLNDQEASVLKTLIPDIVTLVERDVVDAAQLDSKAAQLRLFSTVANVLRRVQQPTIILLEDLHWAGDESLELIRWLLRIVPEVPIMLIGSFRDDESLHLPSRLTGMSLLKLKRLSEENISQLTVAMLGASAVQPQVIGLLNRETEGNVYFIVEVIRALAEEAGQIDKIGMSTLPANVFSGGIRKIVQRRLSQIPENARSLLNLAAVAGRQLDVAVLRFAAPDVDIDEWLSICVNAAVLDASEGRWRFAHDKLREELLKSIAAEHSPTLHQKVATAIETVYPSDSRQFTALSEHWLAAGNNQKSAHYALLAGEEALQNGANHQAIDFLNKALTLDHTLTNAAKAHLERLIGEAYLGLGRLTESRQRMEHVLTLLGYPTQGTQGQQIAQLLRQVIQQIAHRLYLPAPMNDPQQLAQLLDAAGVWERIGELNYYTNNTIGTVSGGVHALNLAERAPSSPVLAKAYANMAVIGGVIPLRRVAKYYSNRAMDTLSKLTDPGLRAFVLGRISVHKIGNAQWAACDDLKESIQIAQQVGFHRQWAESQSVLGLAIYLQGQFQESAHLFDELFATSLRADDIHNQARGLYWSAQARLRLGQIDQAIELLQKSLDLLAEYNESAEHGWIVISHGLLALAYTYQGKYKLAEPHLKHITAASITSFAILEGYTSATEVKLAFWEMSQDAQQWESSAAESLTILKKYARVFSVGKPRYLLYRGLWFWLKGDSKQAQKMWQQSLKIAKDLRMPFEEALAHYEVGRHGIGDHEAQLRAALKLFQQLEASYHATRTESLIAPSAS